MKFISLISLFTLLTFLLIQAAIATKKRSADHSPDNSSKRSHSSTYLYNSAASPTSHDCDDSEYRWSEFITLISTDPSFPNGKQLFGSERESGNAVVAWAAWSNLRKSHVKLVLETRQALRLSPLRFPLVTIQIDTPLHLLSEINWETVERLEIKSAAFLTLRVPWDRLSSLRDLELNTNLLDQKLLSQATLPRISRLVLESRSPIAGRVLERFCESGLLTHLNLHIHNDSMDMIKAASSCANSANLKELAVSGTRIKGFMERFLHELPFKNSLKRLGLEIRSSGEDFQVRDFDSMKLRGLTDLFVAGSSLFNGDGESQKRSIQFLEVLKMTRALNRLHLFFAGSGLTFPSHHLSHLKNLVNLSVRGVELSQLFDSLCKSESSIEDLSVDKLPRLESLRGFGKLKKLHVTKMSLEEYRQLRANLPGVHITHDNIYP